MALKTVLYGDILDYDVETIVVPELPLKRVLPEITSRVYEAAGYKAMMNEYLYGKRKADEIRGKRFSRKLTEFEEKNTPLIIVTPGFDLRAKYVIHIELHLPTWRDEQTEPERFEIKNLLLKYYYYTLEFASKTLKTKSIAFPLLGTSLFGVPQEFSRAIAEKAISSWYDKYFARRTSGDDTPDNKQDETAEWVEPHIVIPRREKNAKPAALPVAPAIAPPAAKARQNSPVPEESSFDLDKIINECDKQFDERQRESGLKFYEFCKKQCLEYIDRIPNKSKLSKKLGFNPSVLTRFKHELNGEKNTGQLSKRRAIAISIAIGLDDYERYEFVRCAGHDYPLDSEDDPFGETVERIIRTEPKVFAAINNKICKINPDFDLTKPEKKQPKQKKQQQQIR